MLIPLLLSPAEAVQRQAAKALANLGVNGVCRLLGRDMYYACTVLGGFLVVSMLRGSIWDVRESGCFCSSYLRCAGDNKSIIAGKGGIPPLIKLAKDASPGVQVEAIAALANLAVNGAAAQLCGTHVNISST